MIIDVACVQTRKNLFRYYSDICPRVGERIRKIEKLNEHYEVHEVEHLIQLRTGSTSDSKQTLVTVYVEA